VPLLLALAPPLDALLAPAMPPPPVVALLVLAPLPLLAFALEVPLAFAPVTVLSLPHAARSAPPRSVALASSARMAGP
jgi:hypothetical protein